MSPALVGTIIGAVVGIVNYVMLKQLATRVSLAETKRILGIVAMLDLAIFPVLGFLIGTYAWG